MRHAFLLGVLCLLGLCVAASVGAEETEPYIASVPLQSTNWTNDIPILKFYQPGKTLYSVEFQVTGHVEGPAKYESYDAAASTVIMTLSADIQVLRGASLLGTVSPTASQSYSAGAWDGTFDWGGSSGGSHTLSADLLGSWTLTDSADLAAFTGTGADQYITLSGKATGHSFGEGAGNVDFQLRTQASANVAVTYYYGNVPEPPAILALLSGLAGVSGYIGRRRKQLS